MASESDTVRILSLDGGGIRGIVPALILSALQKLVGTTPLVDFFDVVAGTSTGGLIRVGQHGSLPDDREPARRREHGPLPHPPGRQGLRPPRS
jgi:patatin-like phospholipase/acyl hydrolase